jgi:DNA-binding LytR/AlgR family response regulator
MKAVIVEDELIAAQNLQRLIGEVAPDIEVLTVLQSVEDSVDWFSTQPAPDLVFMDIHLADGYSFSIFGSVQINCPVIFTTAYDEYALKAFEVNSIDYLLKPLNRKSLERAIAKFRQLGWFSPEYRREFPEKVEAARNNESAPATTHSMFQSMADIASIEGDFIDPAYSLVSPTFDYRAPRRYLNDHNLAVPFPKTGLSDEDLENFRRHGIDLSY